jgi:hypothetical protein
VVYLVEVCDPCESDKFAYPVNGIQVSDFITPHYYDPSGGSGVQYSFRGKVPAPHTVLDDGYVSFGNPADNHWYQLIVRAGAAQLRDLGIIQSTNGKSLRELVDGAVRESRKSEHYRTRSAVGGTAGPPPSAQRATSEARAKILREYVKTLK